MDPTYDVSVWAISVYDGKRGKTYYVQWKVGARRFKESFKTRALADSFRSDLITATKKGEPFDLSSGRPVSALRSEVDADWFALQPTTPRSNGQQHHQNTVAASLRLLPTSQ
jgi:hypothetical protein